MTLFVMGPVETICLLAAILWIAVVVAALGVGLRLVLKFRARRRRMNRIFDVVRAPARQLNQSVVRFLADAFDVPPKRSARGSRQALRRQRASPRN